jgi:basic membrane protein A
MTCMASHFNRTLATSRRGVLAGLLASALVLTAAAPAALAEETEVAALFTQSVSQGNWDPGGYAAFKAMAEKYGFKPSYVEEATYEKAPAILRQLAGRGVKMIICHSSGYAAAIKEVAPSYPDTQFVLYSYAGSTDGIKNYTAWSVDWDQYGYVVGALAAAASKSGQIAVVAAEPIPSTERSVEFMERGAKAANPKVSFTTIYTGSFSDVAKAKEVSIGAIARGADFLIPSADTADAGTQQAAEEEGVFTMGAYIDQSARFPGAIVASTELNFAKAYDEMGEMLKAGTLGDKIFPMTLANDGWTLSRPFHHVDTAVETAVFALMDKVARNEIDIAN